MKPVQWKKANGEMLGFAACGVLLIFIVFAVTAFTSYTIKMEQLTVAGYAAGRAAVVSSDADLANERAYAVLKTVYGNSSSSTTETTSAGSAWFTLTWDGVWQKGKIATITVKQNIPAIFPLSAMTIERSIAMMIESDNLGD